MNLDYLIRELKDEDFHDWEFLYSEYFKFYGLEPHREKLQNLWSFLRDPNHSFEGQVC